MVADVAEKLQAITEQIEPETTAFQRAWSPIGLRGYVAEWTAEFDERDARKQALTDILAQLPADAHPDYTASVVLHHFDVKPKGGKE
ncbi:Uncharacterised protein [Mycobacteroides abscessus subsp. bolletii]|nr:Uncharacterised protein [Mycobacteroides abscessus subsp. bolletii]